MFGPFAAQTRPDSTRTRPECNLDLDPTQIQTCGSSFSFAPAAAPPRVTLTSPPHHRHHCCDVAANHLAVFVDRASSMSPFLFITLCLSLSDDAELRPLLSASLPRHHFVCSSLFSVECTAPSTALRLQPADDIDLVSAPFSSVFFSHSRPSSSSISRSLSDFLSSSRSHTHIHTHTHTHTHRAAAAVYRRPTPSRHSSLPSFLPRLLTPFCIRSHPNTKRRQQSTHTNHNKHSSGMAIDAAAASASSLSLPISLSSLSPFPLFPFLNPNPIFPIPFACVCCLTKSRD